LVSPHCAKFPLGMFPMGCTPKVSRIRKIPAYREWIFPHAKGLTKLNRYHHYVFRKNEKERTTIKYKQWFDSQWVPDVVVLLRTIPTDFPLLVMPKESRMELDKLRKTITVGDQINLFTSGEKQQWADFFSTEREVLDLYKSFTSFEGKF